MLACVTSQTSSSIVPRKLGATPTVLFSNRVQEIHSGTVKKGSKNCRQRKSTAGMGSSEAAWKARFGQGNFRSALAHVRTSFFLHPSHATTAPSKPSLSTPAGSTSAGFGGSRTRNLQFCEAQLHPHVLPGVGASSHVSSLPASTRWTAS